VVLAAGASRRFGSQKLLADLHGKPVVRWSVERVLEARPGQVVVVVGHQGEAVRAALEGLPVRVTTNGAWSEGIGSSLRAGIAALPSEAEAAMIALGDEPTVKSADIIALLAAYAASDKEIIVPSYRGQHAHPVIFARRLFRELLAIDGDRGARNVIASDASRVLVVDFDAPPAPDVDTREQLRTLSAETIPPER
jgi:molybdenum cofactor cytidylyltransferase